MSIKEEIVKCLQADYDTWTACELADKDVKEIKAKMFNKPIGTILKWRIVSSYKIYTLTIRKTA